MRTGAKDDVEGHTDQAGTNPRAGQVFNEPSSEPMKMTTCTAVVKWRYSCASPSSPSALRLAPAASAPDALRGSLAFRGTQLPLCPMARLGAGFARRPPPARASPASVSPAPGAQGRAGAGGRPGEAGAASGPLTTPHRRPRRLGGGQGERRGGAPCPFPRGSRQHPHEGGTDRTRRAWSDPLPGLSAQPSPLGGEGNTNGGIRWSKEGTLRSRRPFQPLLLPRPRGVGASLSSPLG